MDGEISSVHDPDLTECADWLRAVNLRVATSGDLQLLERLSAPFNEGGPDAKSIKGWMEQPYDFGIIASAGGIDLGAVWWRLTPGGKDFAEWREPFLALKQSAQRQGLGPCLLSVLMICAWASPEIERLYAFPRSGDLHQKIVDMLEGLGFERRDQTGLREVRTGAPLPAWRLGVAEEEPEWRPGAGDSE